MTRHIRRTLATSPAALLAGVSGCCSRDSSLTSDAIIGGADEPTHIVVTSAVNWPLVICVLLVAAAAGLILYLCFKHKK
ncbi:MAG: hypothetical protein ACLU8W_08435 [Clostridia bacterium]